MKYFLKKVKVKVELFIQDKFIPLWVKLLDYIRKLGMLFTFISMIVGTVFAFYYLFVAYWGARVFITCLFLLTMVFINHALQS